MKLARLTVVQRLLALLVVLSCATARVHAQESEAVMLIATDRLAGSAYEKTVLIAAPLANGASIGFILNRPTKATLGNLYPGHAPSRNVVDPVYFGGPALSQTLFAVTRPRPEGAKSMPFMPGLFLAVDGASIDRVIETVANDARYFAGFVAWDPGELDAEIRAQAWEVLPADAKVVFRADPANLWQELHRAPGGRGRVVNARFSIAP